MSWTHPSISTYIWAINLVLTGPCAIPSITIHSVAVIIWVFAVSLSPTALTFSPKDVNVTSKCIWQVGVNFCGRSLHIVHCKLNYIYYLHNACKHNKWVFVCIFDPFLRIFRWFQHFTKICITCITFWWFWALHDVSLPNWMKYFSTREPILQKYHVHFSLHDYHSIQLQLFSSQNLGFPD